MACLHSVVKKAGNIPGAPALQVDENAAAVRDPLTGQDNLSCYNSGLIYYLIIRLLFILKAGPDEYYSQRGKNDQDNAKKKFPLEGHPKIFHD